MAEIGSPRRLQLRHGTAATWAARNPVLRLGEPGIENDTQLWKTGDGVTAWNALPYMTGGGGAGPAGPAGAQGMPIPGQDGEDGDWFMVPGPAGGAGAPGTPGSAGAAGPPGPPGFDGEDGDNVAGFIPGPVGATGAGGTPGTPGAAGASGFTIPGQDGDDGDYMQVPPYREHTHPTSAGSFAYTDFTKDLGASNRSGTFDITGLAGLTAGKNVDVMQTAQAIATKGNARDEPEMDQIQVTGYVVDANTIRCYWQAPSVVVGTYAFGYVVSS